MNEEEIREVFAPLGPVSIRRMFSGKGVYFQGVIVAILYGNELRLKADSISSPEFEAAGSTQWAYEGRRGEVMMPYWSIPHDAFDNSDSMDRWVPGLCNASDHVIGAGAAGAKRTIPRNGFV